MADAKRRKPAASPPITSHPLFPVTVVLWFGALFGLCSVAIRPGLIEHAVLVTGIDRVIPMAAPPLGTTTRILLALMMTAIGCLVGLVVARGLAKPAPQAAARRRRPAADHVIENDADSPVPLFGAGRRAEPAAEPDEDEEPEAPPTIRRRQLTAIVAEERFDDHAPVPGALPILNVADLEIESFDAALDEDVWVRRSEPLQLAPRAEAVPVSSVEAEADEPKSDRPSSGNRLFDAYTHAAPMPLSLEDEAPAPGFELLPREADIVGADIVEADIVAADTSIAPVIEADDQPSLPETAMESASAAGQDAPASRDMTAAERIATAPLDALSHLELLERLALTIARRRANKAQGAEPAPVAPAPAAPRPAFDLPPALRAVPTEPDDDALLGYVPPRNIARSNDEALAAGYSSLRSLTRPVPAGASPAESTDKAEAPPAKPVIAFPAAGEPQEQRQADTAPPRVFDAPRTPGDRTEQALRDALATLQRMSGAA